MKNQKSKLLFITLILTFAISFGLNAQQWIKEMPGYERYKEMSPKIRSSVQQGQVSVKWAEDGKSFDYNLDGKKYQFDLKKKKATEIGEGEKEESPMNRYRRMYGNRPQRGRQFTTADSPDGKSKAVYRDGNVFITGVNGENEQPVTTTGSEKNRIKFGSATWVYGEELDQNTAMWWSPDSKKLAFYSFDFTKVKDYYLQYKQTELYDSLEVEPYTKVGAINPEVGLLIYDVDSKKLVKVDIRDGKPFTNEVVGHYIYGIEWSPDGTELLFHRANRRQNIMEWTAASAETGKCRVIVHEEWLPSYTTNAPEMKFWAIKTGLSGSRSEQVLKIIICMI